MGEAKRRKMLDPNYGKHKSEEIIGHRTESEWRKKLGFTVRKWKKVQPNFRVVDNYDDVDDSIDGLWVYKNEYGQEMLSFTGYFAECAFD